MQDKHMETFLQGLIMAQEMDNAAMSWTATPDASA